MAKYEFIFKVKEDNSWQVKYRCVVDEKRFERVKSDYEKIKTLHTDWNSVILINELDENKEFVKVVQ